MTLPPERVRLTPGAARMAGRDLERPRRERFNPFHDWRASRDAYQEVLGDRRARAERDEQDDAAPEARSVFL